MINNFACVSIDCQERLLNDWKDIVAHQQLGHEVKEKEQLLNIINTKLNQKKSHILQDLLARINKIMINQEESLQNMINQKFADAYKFWKDEIQQLQQLQEYIFPNQITSETTLPKIVDIYQSLDNDQLHVFSEFINQVEQIYSTLIKQMNQILDKVELEIKVVQQQLSTQIQKNKALRELKNQSEQILKEQLIEIQKIQKNDESQESEKKSISLSNEFIQPQKLSVFSERENKLYNNKNEYQEKLNKQSNVSNFRENFYQQNSNQRNIQPINNHISQSPEDQNHISFHEIIDKQNTFRTNKINEQNYQELKQPLRGYKEYQPNNYQSLKQDRNSGFRDNSIEKYYKKRTQNQNYNSQQQQLQQQQQQPYSIIIYEKSTSPPKPPPLRGYKERQQEDSNNKLKLLRSADKRQYLDSELINIIKSSTSKRFDIDKSEKHMKYSNKFSTIFCPKECFAIVEGVFKLSQHHQCQIFLRSQDLNYEIEIGIVNYTQIKQRNQFPNFYGINRTGECLQTKQQTPIELNSDQSYLLSYRYEQKLLIIVDITKNLQHPFELPDDEKSEFVFFIRMRNLLIQLI